MLETTSSTIRALIVDDHPVVRYGLRYILETDTGIEIVGELDDIHALGDVLAEAQPDVVLLDLELEGTHGVEALRRLREQSPTTRVIIYTSHDDEDRIVQAAELGVDGYLLKGCPKEELLGAIHAVHNGGKALEPSVAGKLMKHMDKRSSCTHKSSVELSKREYQVLKHLADGKKNRKIAEKLFISESTVKFHVHAILSKLGAGNRTEAVSMAAQLGVIELSPGD
jgi:NarL family two-component system response regulator LiaR